MMENYTQLTFEDDEKTAKDQIVTAMHQFSLLTAIKSVGEEEHRTEEERR